MICQNNPLAKLVNNPSNCKRTTVWTRKQAYKLYKWPLPLIFKQQVWPWILTYGHNSFTLYIVLVIMQTLLPSYMEIHLCIVQRYGSDMNGWILAFKLHACWALTFEMKTWFFLPSYPGGTERQDGWCDLILWRHKMS